MTTDPTAPPRRAVCLDGPLEGAEVTFGGDEDVAVFYDTAGTPVTYRLVGPLGAFPGTPFAARVVVLRPAL